MTLLGGLVSGAHSSQQMRTVGDGRLIVSAGAPVGPERHCGRLWVESQAGEGTVFWFTLPARGEGDS